LRPRRSPGRVAPEPAGHRGQEGDHGDGDRSEDPGQAEQRGAEIPEKERSPEVVRTIEAAAEYFLRHHIHLRSHDLSKAVKLKWLKLGFPLMWDGDALEVFGILAKLGFRDQRMGDAAELILSKQDAAGRWALEDTYNGRFQVDIEKKGRPSKWVTFLALKALKAYSSPSSPGASR
jgi:hypothetical protein